jgi:hypothetical protein
MIPAARKAISQGYTQLPLSLAFGRSSTVLPAEPVAAATPKGFHRRPFAAFYGRKGRVFGLT